MTQPVRALDRAIRRQPNRAFSRTGAKARSFTYYLRPDGVSLYRRPDGTSRYERP